MYSRYLSRRTQGKEALLVCEMPEGVSAGKAEEVVHVRLGSLDVSMVSKLKAPHCPPKNHART